MMDWEKLLDDCVNFTQRLIQTPSMPFEEGAIAKLVTAEMRRLQFDEVWLDEMGNVNGRLFGQDRSLSTLVLNSHLDHVDPGDPALWPVPPFSGEVVNGRLFGQDRSLSTLVLNSHLDHVDPGDPALWPSPPFSGEIVDGRIVGRGAADIKGPLAVQVYSMAALLRMGEQPSRDVVFSGVVQEEIGGGGAEFWVKNLDYPVALVVLSEPTENNLALGHRGIMQMWVRFNGRSVHASVSEKGQNPNFALSAFLERLQSAQTELSIHPHLGPTTVTPTIIEVDTKSPNVTPAWARVLLDFRTASESINSLQAFVHRLAGDQPHTIANAWTNEPFPDSDETIYGYDTPPESAVVQKARTAIARGMGREPSLTRYNFATDGRHFVPYHIPIIGYSPAEEDQAHIAGESIAIAKMAESLRGYATLLHIF